ncbi:MAG TPA: universal stress protein [Jatrophihabitans sp.]|nr:universal stress protein [Jatrophihabitans sp.]
MSSMSRSIVVGYANTPGGRQALTVAAELAADLGARLHVVHVIDISDYPIDPDSPDWDAGDATQLAAERADVERALADRLIDWRYELQRGNPVRTLANAAAREQARMIVVGAGHASGLDRLLRASRSVAHGLERTGVPVLVVPAH